jgi:SAM-dependent methyltransferase
MISDDFTRSYWDEVFAKAPLADPTVPIPVPEIESGLAWVSEQGGRVLDFGCGSGRLPLRCLALGAEQVTGIDLSGRAIDAARAAAIRAGFEECARFTAGGVLALTELSDASFKGAVLSNILDNMHPSDARQVLTETWRVLSEGGRLLVRLNPHFEPADFPASQGYVELEANLYREPSGLLFWNLTDLAFKELVHGQFEIETQVVLEQPPGRLYDLIRI